MTLLRIQLIIIITVTIQVAVLNWFSWNSRSWCKSTYGLTLFIYLFFFFLETVGPIEPLIWGENVAPKLVFWLSFSGHVVFCEKNFKAVFHTPSRKSYVHFCRPTRHLLKNSQGPQKLFFAVILENIVVFFFFEKIVT